jgi:iron complex outermembrane receptor protein
MKRVLPVLAALMLHPPLSGQVYDTLALEDVTITVLSFRERKLEATGGIYSARMEVQDQSYQLTSGGIYDQAPGVHMASGTYSTNQLLIRGIGSRTPYATNRIRAYLDDIPLTTGDGFSTIEDLDPLSIGSLEILKGPSSALYGSGLGGVVRLNSPYPSGSGFNAKLSAEMGSYGGRRYGVVSGFKNQDLALTAGVSHTSLEGYRENSEYARNNLFLAARYFRQRHAFSITLSLVDLFARIPSSLNEIEFLNEPSKAADSWSRVKGYESYMKVIGGIAVASDLTDRLSNHLVLFSAYSDPYESRPFNILDDRSASVGFRESLQVGSKKFKVQTGLEYFHEWYHWQVFKTEGGQQGGVLSDHSEVRRYLNIFALSQWRPGEKILVDGGFNFNLLHYGLETTYRTDSTDPSGEYSYQPVVSPRLGVSFRHSGQIYSYASAGHGFSAPSLQETLLPQGEVNTDLKPETGWNLELGNRGTVMRGKIEYDLSLYTIFLSNLLVTQRTNEETFTGANAGKASYTGMEFLASYHISASQAPSAFHALFTAGYNLSLNRFREFTSDGIDYKGKMLPGIPSQKLQADLTVFWGGAEAGVIYRYTGRQWMNDANESYYPGYHLVDVKIQYGFKLGSLPLGLDLYVGIRNLFNRHHASMILVNAPSFEGEPPRYYYPGQPRHFYIGLRLRLGSS